MKQPSAPRYQRISLESPQILLLVAICMLNGARGQTVDAELQPKVQFVTVSDPYGKVDLRWTGQRSTLDDEPAEVVLENAGEQTVSGFQIGWALFIPEGCGVREEGVPRSQIQLAPFESHTVSPGARVTVGPYHLSADTIRNFARHAHSPVVIAQAGVVRARFANGFETIQDVERRKKFVEDTASYPCQADQRSAAAENEMKTFSNGVFQFQYAALLIPCEKKRQEKAEGFYWAQDSCSAYFPVCDDAKSETSVCIAYPKKKFEDAPTFEAAAFSVAIEEDASNEKDCLAVALDAGSRAQKTATMKTINEIKFKVFETGEGGMSQSVDSTVYLIFHQGKCYALSISMAGANSGAFDPGINEFTPEDAKEVQGRLEQALNSFRFLQ